MLRIMVGTSVPPAPAALSTPAITGPLSNLPPATFDAGHVSIETYLMDFEGDLYGERMEIEVLHRLREERAFAGIEEIKAQITLDVQEARAWLTH